MLTRSPRMRVISSMVQRRCLATKAARIYRPGSSSELEDVPALEFRYDIANEVPILVKTLSPCIDEHISNLTQSSTRLLLYDDICKYMIHKVLREIFLHVKMLPDDSQVFFADRKDYRSILMTFQKLGSLFTYKLGTCSLKGPHGDLRVVLDTGVWKTVEKETSKYYGYSGPWKFVKPTGYKMFCISKLLFQYDAFRLCKQDLQVRYRAFARREAERLGINLDDADELADQQRIKVAVEVDRSVIGKGNLVFFMDQEEAKDPDKVYQEITKHISLNSGLGVVHYARHLREEGDFLRCYSLVQDPSPFKTILPE